MTILYFVIGLGLLIFIHELGHFLVAKANGIRVERFSLGFGPRIFKFQWGETEYCLSALPLGGYVKMTGQEDFEAEDIKPVDDPRAFSSKGIWARLSVVLAGPVMNLVLPFLLMPLVFMIGRAEPKFFQQPPEVMGVLEGSAAEQAGIQPGDLLIKVDGHEVATWKQVLSHMVRPAETTLAVAWERNGQVENGKITLTEDARVQGGLSGIEPAFFVDAEPVIEELTPDSPAKKAGLQPGDRIVAVGEKPIEYWWQMSEAVQDSKGEPMTITVERNEERQTFTLTPTFHEKTNRYVIGAVKTSNADFYETRRYSFSESMVKGFQENIILFGMTFKVLKDLFTLKASYKELGGPIRITQILGKAAQQGIGNFLFFLAFLSIQLGILNLLPIPVLDGGHVVFIAYEGIVRKPLSMKGRLIAQQVGMFLLLTLIVLVTINDIDAIWGFQNIFESIKGWF